MYDIIIIGAGVIGTSIARRLSKYKLNILLLEAENDVSMGASKANSAIVHGGYAESHDKVKGRVCYKGRKEYENLNKELNFGFSKIGSLVLAFEEEQKKGLEDLMENGIKNGLPDLKILNHDEILEIEPNVNPEVKYALYCEGAGVCSPYELVIALAENAIENGVELKLNSQVVDISKDNDIFTVNTKDNKNYKGKYIINASGINSGKISKMVGVDYFDISPRSGEYLLMKRGSGSKLNHVLFQMPTKMGKGILVTPTYHNNLLLGPDAIDDEEIDKSTDVKRLANIYRQGLQTTDILNINEFIRSFTGVRAVSSTNDFIIEASTVKNFINVAGIQSPGLTSSPEIARLVENILKDLGLSLKEKTDYNPYRKPIINRKTEKDFLEPKELKEKLDLPIGTEGRMVCRCEQVLESTIRDAMNRGIKVTTIDGIKRRTRAGMGFCQGTFCRPRVAQVMSQELGYEVDPSFDIEHSGINRVSKKDLVNEIKDEIHKK